MRLTYFGSLLASVALAAACGASNDPAGTINGGDSGSSGQATGGSGTGASPSSSGNAGVPDAGSSGGPSGGESGSGEGGSSGSTTGGVAGSQAGTGASEGGVCEPGAARVCVLPSDVCPGPSTQTCLPDGSGWGSCVCPTDATGGFGGSTGGSGGVAGSAGATPTGGAGTGGDAMGGAGGEGNALVVIPWGGSTGHECPDSLVNAGAAPGISCSVGEGTTCADDDHRCECGAASFEGAPWHCVPSRPDCPEAMPDDGDPCVDTDSCDFVRDAHRFRCDCEGDEWSCTDINGFCSTVGPSTGLNCAGYEGESCDYLRPAYNIPDTPPPANVPCLCDASGTWQCVEE